MRVNTVELDRFGSTESYLVENSDGDQYLIQIGFPSDWFVAPRYETKTKTPIM
jgi:hypothetical protein